MAGARASVAQLSAICGSGQGFSRGGTWHRTRFDPGADSSLADGLLKDYIRSSSNTSLPTMRYSTRVKPISYLKANAAEVLANLVEVREPMIITQHGEAKAILQDIASYEQTQETMALLKILALGNREIEEGKTKPAAEVFEQLRAKAKSA